MFASDSSDIANIREATVEDAAGCAQVHVDSWRTTYVGIVPRDYLASLSHERREPAWKHLLSPGTPDFTYVAEVEGQGIVGFAGGGPEREGNREFPSELQGMYILQPWQRKGIGRRLTMVSAERLLAMGFSSMLLWALAENPAVSFYEALGGRVVGQRSAQIGGATLKELAYGWNDIASLVAAGP